METRDSKSIRGSMGPYTTYLPPSCKQRLLHLLVTIGPMWLMMEAAIAVLAQNSNSRTLVRTIRFVVHIITTRWCLTHSAGRQHR